MLSRFLSSLCAVCVLCGELFAAAPTIEALAPGAGQRGTEFTLTITGSRLADPQELMLYAPGVVCSKLEAKSETEVVASLKSAPDCRLGQHAFRLRTKGGASEVRTFHVTRFPVVAEKNGNDTPAKAQPVALNTTVAGVTDSGDVDCYAVALKKGQRLAAEVEGVRIGADVTDTALVVLGPDGKQLAAVDDTSLFRQDPFVTLVAPADGTYVVQVRDSNFAGGPTNRYLLHIGTFTRPAAVFPPGGHAGTEVAVKFVGDAGGDRTVTLKLPQAGEPFELYPSDPGGDAPTPNPFRVSPFPNVNETEPNDDFTKANAAVAWPVAFNGIIEKVGDVDHFRFRAKRGDVIDVQSFAFRLGSPVDTVVAVLDARGELVAANDDDDTHDSRVEVTIPADGEYFVRVTDKRKQGGPAFVYRVELTAPKPSVAVFLPERSRRSQDRQVIAVPRGNRVTAYLAVRRDGFTGPVTVTPGELPAGVKLVPGTVAEDEYLLPVVFEAAPDAPLGGKLVSFTAKGTDAGATVTGGFTQEVILVRGPGDSSLHAITLDRLVVVVVDEMPLSVTIVPPAAPLATDGTLDVKVRVTRGKDFTDPIEVFFSCLPPGVEAPASVAIPAEKSEAVVTLVASPDASVGDWPFIVEAAVARPARTGRDPGAMGMGGGRPRRRGDTSTPVASEARTVRIAAAPIVGKFAPAAAEQGKTVKVVCKLDSAAPLPAGLTAKLDGLPPRASAPIVPLKPDAKQIEFVVTVDPTSPLGEHAALVCELTGTVDGTKVVYRVGRGAVLKIDAAGAVKLGPDGKPLSPLDILRMQEKK
jgi:hypothetical protein